MSVRVAILDDYQGVALSSADWSSLDGRVSIDVFRDTIHDEDSLVNRLHDYEIVCTMRERTSFTKTVLDRLPNLKFITTTALRNASIDSVYAKERGIPVSGTDSDLQSTTEHIWALLLATSRKIVAEHNNVRNGGSWQSVVPITLGGKTLGIMGVGNLGIRIANIAKVFGMNVIAWSPNLTAERADAAGMKAVSKEEFFRESDIVSIHMFLAESTRGIVGKEELALMKRTALLINTSRGPLVDEKALVEALQAETIAGAGLDVYAIEPLPLGHPLRSVKNVTTTPHNAYVNDVTYRAWWEQTIENIANYLDGKPTRLLA